MITLMGSHRVQHGTVNEYLSTVHVIRHEKRRLAGAAGKGQKCRLTANRKGNASSWSFPKSFGSTVTRIPGGQHNTGDASDVVGLPGIHVEAKHQERMQLYDWMDQAKHDAKESEKDVLPAVFHKRNNHKILVTMELDDWMAIYREYEAGMSLKEGADDGRG